MIQVTKVKQRKKLTKMLDLAEGTFSVAGRGWEKVGRVCWPLKETLDNIEKDTVDLYRT